MAVFVNDLFNGTSGQALSAYDSAWQRTVVADESVVISSAARVRGGTLFGTDRYYRNTAVPATPDYTIIANCFVASTNTDQTIHCGLIARSASALGTPAADCYRMKCLAGPTSSNVRLERIVSGTIQQLFSGNFTFSVSNSYELKLVLVGSSIKGYVNGAEQFSVVDTTFAAAGFAGLSIGLGSDTVGFHISDFNAESFATSSLTVAPSTQANLSPPINLSSTTNLVVDNLLNVINGGAWGITQGQFLVVANLIQANPLATVAVTQGVSATINLSVLNPPIQTNQLSTGAVQVISHIWIPELPASDGWIPELTL